MAIHSQLVLDAKARRTANKKANEELALRKNMQQIPPMQTGYGEATPPVFPNTTIPETLAYIPTDEEISESLKDPTEELSKKLYGEGGLTSEDRNKMLLEAQGTTKDLLDRQLEIQKQERDMALRQSETNKEANLAALQSQLIAAPDKLQVSTTTPLITGISKDMQEKIDLQVKNAALQGAKAEKLKKDLEIAQREQRWEFASDLQKQIYQAEAMKAQYEGAAEKQKAQAAQDLMSLKKQQSDNFLSSFSALNKFSPNLLGNMSAQDIMSFFENSGSEISPIMAQGVASSFKEILELETSKKEEDKIDARLKRELLIQSILKGQETEVSKAVSSFNAIEEAVLGGQISKEAAEQLKIKLGLSEKPLSVFDERAKKAEIDYKNAQTEKIRQDAMKIRTELSELKGADGENDLLGKLTSLQVGVTPPTRSPNNKFYGQCGAVVNDLAELGPGFFGSSYSSKANKINKSVEEGPAIGDIFISNLGVTKDKEGKVSGYGHTGFIMDIELDENGNKIYTLGDSNRYNDLKWNVRQVTEKQLINDEKVTGYYSKPLAVKTGVNSPDAVYKDELIPLYSKYTRSKTSLTKADMDQIKEMGMTFNDFAKQATAARAVTDDMGKRFALSLLDDIKYLEKAKWKDRLAVATPFQVGAKIPFTEAANLRASWNNFSSKIALKNLQDLKAGGATFGALSDQELNFITDASKNLSMAMKDDRWKEELENMKKELQRIVDTSEKTREEKEEKSLKELKAEEKLQNSLDFLESPKSSSRYDYILSLSK